MTSGKVFVFIALGLVFWFGAALFIHLVGSTILVGGWMHIGAFVLTTLTGPFFVVTAALVTRTPLHNMMYPTVIMLTVAMFCDGAAITYLPNLYGGAGPGLAYGAAQILWGAAAALLTALLFERTGPKRT